MIRTAAGVQIPFPERIHEKYIIKKDFIRFNISFEKLEPLFRDFLDGLTEPIFLIIQIPLNQKEEVIIQKPEESNNHSEVLYLDRQTKKQITGILDAYGQILFNDGMSRFGVASHATGDEIFIQKYKIVDIYSKTIDRYAFLLKKYHIEKTLNLITPWDTFSRGHPGQCSKITVNNIDVYDVAEKLKEQGMYRAKIEED
jgi:hypothetical protein